MPVMNVDLWDDGGRYIVARVSVQCKENEARLVEKKMGERVKFLGRKLPSGTSRNMTFIQFKKLFFR